MQAHVGSQPYSEVLWLIDQIRSLTAQLAAVTAERDSIKEQRALIHNAYTALAEVSAKIETERDRLREALREACDISDRVIADTQVLPSTDAERIAALRSLASTDEGSKEPGR